MVEKVHQSAPKTVADRSGDAPKPAPGAPSKPGPARPTPGNADAPVKPLPDIKPDSRRALSRDIDVGLGDIRSGKANDDKGKIDAGKTRIGTGIGNVVMYLTGKNVRATYAEAKRATDEILAAYSRRPDVKEVVDGVNSYLQNIVVYDFLLARAAADSTRLDDALEIAKKYVTDAGPDSRARTDRLQSMINAMRDADVSQPVINATRERCYEAIRSKP
jgi:hypothetical protein